MTDLYGGPQLSWQNTIHHGKIQFETTNSNYSRQTTNTHGENKNNFFNLKFITARAKHSRQQQKTHGKSKRLTAKAKHSRQKQNTHGKSKTLTAKSNQEWWSAVVQVRGVALHNQRYADFTFIFPGLLSVTMIQMIDRPNTAPIGQDKKTLTFKRYSNEFSKDLPLVYV